MKNLQTHPKLITVTRQDLSHGYQIAQSCHAVADFAYYQSKFFNQWRTNSNYKICLASKDEDSLEKLYNKLKEKGASVIAFREPDMGNQLTAITLYGEEQYRNYTKYLPLVGKNNDAIDRFKAQVSKTCEGGSNPPSITIPNAHPKI